MKVAEVVYGNKQILLYEDRSVYVLRLDSYQQYKILCKKIPSQMGKRKRILASKAKPIVPIELGSPSSQGYPKDEDLANATMNHGRWGLVERYKFFKYYLLYIHDEPFRKISAIMKVRTFEQVRSHAQKTFAKFMKIIREELAQKQAEKALQSKGNQIVTRSRRNNSKRQPKEAKASLSQKSEFECTKELQIKIRQEMNKLLTQISLQGLEALINQCQEAREEEKRQQENSQEEKKEQEVSQKEPQVQEKAPQVQAPQGRRCHHRMVVVLIDRRKEYSQSGFNQLVLPILIPEVKPTDNIYQKLIELPNQNKPSNAMEQSNRFSSTAGEQDRINLSSNLVVDANPSAEPNQSEQDPSQPSNLGLPKAEQTK